MDIHEHLVQLAKQGGTPAELVAAATRAIAEDLSFNACYLFVPSEAGTLALESAYGANTDLLSGARVESIATQAVEASRPGYAKSDHGTLVAVPMMSRGRRAGALVVERTDNGQGISEDEVAHLSAVATQLVDLVGGVRAIRSIEASRCVKQESLRARPLATDQQILNGTAASPGIGIGFALFRQVFPHQFVQQDSRAGGGPKARERLRDAFQKTQNDLLRMQSAVAGELGEEQALVFAVQLLLLRDPMLQERIERAVIEGSSAAVAVDKATEDFIVQLRKVEDPYIRERSEDIEDLRSRVLGHLLEVEHASADGAHIVVGPRTTPSVIMELKAHGALGVASELGGTTSHGVLLARALGVPAVTGVSGLLECVQSTDLLIVDGNEGRIVVRPTPETIADYVRRGQAQEHLRTEFLEYRHRESITADGLRFQLQANVGLGIDLATAVDNGAAGVGLYRTEFPFIARNGVPTREEQVRIYANAYRAFPKGPISFRILDLAGDKLLASLDVRIARNAFHGYRSMRVLFDYPHILSDQCQAFAIAADGRPLRILVPMVSSLEELRRVKQLVNDALANLAPRAQPPSLVWGAMIEVPAAIEIIGDLSAEVEFFSIGTNDLTQYSLVVDREDPRLASPRNAFHPAILRMLRRAINVAHECGRAISVCGEMAARPELAIVLVAMGIDALSVTPRAIPELKYRLANMRLAPLIADLDHLLACSLTDEIEQALRTYISVQSLAPTTPGL